MGQLAFGVVGAAVGGYFGGPAGASWGWAIGSAIGGVAFAPDGPQTVGPRLDDLKANISTYGQSIPRAYGQVGFMCSIIDMDDIREIENVEEQGKGGDPATVTTFSYTCSFASILCRGEDAEIENTVPVAALNRLIINEKTYYDVRDETNVEAMVASANFARYFVFYPGNQTQLPDPTLEAFRGVGNVPAYRGRAYIVFKDLPLVFFGNQPPGLLRITCEVTMTGTPATGLRLLHTQKPTPGGAGTYSMIMPIVDSTVRILHQGNDYVNLNTIKGIGLSIEELTPEEEEWPDLLVAGDGTVGVTRLAGGDNLRVSQGLPLQINNVSTRLYSTPNSANALPLLLPQTDYLMAVIPSPDQRSIFAFTGPTAGAADKWNLLTWETDDFTWTLTDTGTISTGHVPNAIGPSSSGLFQAGFAESDLRYIWFTQTSGTPGVYLSWIDDSNDLVFIDSLAYDGGLGIGLNNTQIWADDGVAYIIGFDVWLIYTRKDGAAVNGQTLQEVHEAECSLAGLDVTSQVEASALAPILVDGIMIRNLGPTRGVIGALQPSYFYDTYESEYRLKSTLRGGSSVVTIDEEELGASTDGNAKADLINPVRAEEDTLPGAVTITYLDRASDYQPGAQHDRRSAVETDEPFGIEAPIVLSPDAARQVASVWLYNAWIGRTSRTHRVSRKYSYLEPTDIVTIRKTDGTLITERWMQVKTNEGFLEVEAVDEDAALYVQNTEGGNLDQGSEIIIVMPTKLVILDIPMLRESDNDPGFYIAAAGYGGSWPGALILRSTDGGVTYTGVASMSSASIMGSVAIAFGDFAGPMGYDYSNTILVSLFGTDTLSSCTDAELIAGANAFVLGTAANGYEIAQFKTATLVGGNVWRLSQFLRGRRGTEAKMATHVTNSTFVLLDATKLRRIGVDQPAIGLENHYKAVTFGQLATSAPTIAFTNTAASLKPYSGVDPHASGFGGDVTITWTRRGRLYNDWRDGVELQLGEASESYSIDIYDGVTFKRTLTSSTPTVVYSSANQTTDFGAPISPGDADAEIYQLSAIVGRGFPLLFNIT